MSTFVSVGNATQPFPRLLDAVVSVVSQLPQPVFVQYGAYDGFQYTACDAAAFVSMAEFERRVGEATLLIMHAGAGSVIHAVRAGKLPVVVPRKALLGEHVDDHQQEFARELQGLGRLVVCEDVSRLLSTVHDAVILQNVRAGPKPEPRLAGELRILLQKHSKSLQRPA